MHFAAVKYQYIEKTKFILSPVITGLVLLFVYLIKGIYPFGSRTVAYYDMIQQYIPFYYNTWDVLHGFKSLTFDWTAGLGNSMVDNVGNYILSPFNLFFFFIRREDIFNSMSFFLMIKLMTAAFFMNFYIFKEKKGIPLYLAFILSVSYSLSSYNLQYYSNIQFLDIVALFPILVYGHDCLIKKRKVKLYILMLTSCMIISTYLSFMICLYLLLRTFIISQKYNKDCRYKISFDFSFCSIASVLLSSIVTIPTVIVLFSSSRNDVLKSSGGYFNIIKTMSSLYGDQHKFFMLFGCEAGIALLLFVIIFRRDLFNKLYDHFLMIALLVIPIFVEGTNLLWHMGSYVHFPMRFAFILNFEVISLIADFYLIYDEKIQDKENKLYKICIYISAGLIPVILISLFVFILPFRKYGIRDLESYEPTIPFFFMTLLCAFCAASSSKKKYMTYIISMILIFECAIGTYGFVGPEEELSAECSAELLESAMDLGSFSSDITDFKHRYKNMGSDLVTNYSLITHLNTASDWTSGVNSNLLPLRSAMGYSIAYTRLLDDGGTVFTDELFGVTNVLSKEEENDSLYIYESKAGDYNIYSSEYTLPFSVNVDSIPEFSFSSDVFYDQNQLFSELTGINGNLINTEFEYDGDFFESDLINGLTLDLNIVGEKTLYVYVSGQQFGFIINDEIQKIPYLSYKDNVVYPTAFSNGILEFGTFRDERVNLSLIPNPDYINDDNRCCIRIGLMDMDMLKKGNEILSRGEETSLEIYKNSLKISGSAETDGYLMLPIGYNDGFHCSLNGETVGLVSGLNDSLTFVPIEKGKYDIAITYIPKGLVLGVALLFIGIILLFLYSYLKRFGIEKRLGKNFYSIIVLTNAFIALFMYIIPMASNIILRLCK